jgi:short-chain fatty acids transporter
MRAFGLDAALVATPGHFMEKELGLIPVTRTLFAPLNLALVGATLIAMTVLAARCSPRRCDAARRLGTRGR